MPPRPVPSDFRFGAFSPRQRQALTWWTATSPHADKYALICDGSVRSGKSLAMSLSFVLWATATFNGENLGMAGKTISALRRNVIQPLKRMLRAMGYSVDEHLTENRLVIGHAGRTNEYYLFGGRDERSQDLIQGVTLAGLLCDEVALMPESFVNQATARLSVDGARAWFNCNPAGPYHWFKLGWLEQLEQKNALALHFTLDDNWSLSERTKARYRALYRGMFYQRYILGRWVAAEGLIYDMFDQVANTFDDATMPQGLRSVSRRYIGVDYGTQNATVFLDCLDDGQTLWIVNEYYHSGRTAGRQKTDDEYAAAMDAFVGDKRPVVIVDPSAASFKVSLRARGYRLMDAHNDVDEGIKRVALLLTQRRLRVHRANCPNFLQEIAGYVWDDKAIQRGLERPVKVNDHAVDAMRYLALTLVNDYRAHRASA